MPAPPDRPPVDNAFRGPLMGGAADPTFAGALSFMRRRYGRDYAAADVVVWGVPFDTATTNRPGARFGPQALRRASALFDGDPQYPCGRDPFARLAVIDAGDCPIDHARPERMPELVEAEADAILGAGARSVTLGGDHSITLPLLRAHARRHGPLALVRFDAHQDSWDDGFAADGRARISHGSFLTTAVREGLVDPARSVQVGIRTCAPQDLGMTILDAYAVQALGLAEVGARIREVVGGSPAYLTVDIDVLDPAFAPGTGTPVAGGLTSAQLLMLMRATDGLAWTGMDVVEVAPPYDHADITAIAGATVVQHWLQGEAAKAGAGRR